MADKIRVLIADDHAIVRSGVRLLLETQEGIEVVGEARSGDQAVALVEQLRPSLVLMDIAMPGMAGMEATRQIKARHPEVQVLVLTMHRSDEYFFEVLKAGASGYVLKAAETNELIAAVRAVARGEVFLHPSMARQLLSDYLSRVNETEDPGHPWLTAREKEILHLLAEGFSSNEIAEKLVISPSTVHTHRSNLMQKLNLNSRRELIQFARRRGLMGNAEEP
ncbi:MAG TPA: response regulator transcription factor [Anaerolineales bacterium]|nr:response regulator transcription factor [Anaerolineales bacterium]